MVRLVYLTVLPALSLLLISPLFSLEPQDEDVNGPPAYAEFKMEELSAKRESQGRSYLQFLDRKTLNCGVYHLKAGAKDGQSPHGQDEVYYVEKGKAKLRVNDHDMDAVPGSVLFVAAGAKHHFHSIESDLTLLVFFSTAEP